MMKNEITAINDGKMGNGKWKKGSFYSKILLECFARQYNVCSKTILHE
jgi:hypothetical protein